MAQKVLILGDSGTGKSASLRNFKPEELLVINSAGKPLPFKNRFETVTPSFKRLTDDVLDAMDKTDKKVIVIDDAQYIMSFQFMRRLKEKGWDKWEDIQGDFFNIIQACDYMPADVVVYFLSHLTRDEDGREKIKTMGKMLDEKITIEGLFTTVLKTAVKDGRYFFLTQNSGLDTVKSPIGMFPSYAIDNDLKYVDTKIRNYYEIGEYADDETVAQMDQEAEKTEIAKPDSDGRTRRRKAKAETLEKKTEEASESGSENAAVNNVRNNDEESAEAKGRTRRNRKGSDKGSDGSGNENNSQPESASGGNVAEKTDEGTDVSGRMESPSEQPKTRRRKNRTVTAEETPAETEKASEQAENVSQEASLADSTPEESAVSVEPQRRRRKKKD